MQKLIDYISLNLDELFESATIYTYPVKQNFESNSFYINLSEYSEKACLSNRFKLFNKIEIIYTPEDDINSYKIFNEIKEILFKNMIMLKYEDGYIFGENMSAKIIDGRLYFYVDYNFYVFKIDDEEEKMQKLFSYGGLNER